MGRGDDAPRIREGKPDAAGAKVHPQDASGLLLRRRPFGHYWPSVVFPCRFRISCTTSSVMSISGIR